jgi:hypothetical protein
MTRLGPASFMQSDFGSGGHSNFEAVVLTGGQLWHWWRDNSNDAQFWHRGQQITGDAVFPGAIIQADFGSGDHGNFEVVVPLAGPADRVELWHFWHDNSNVTNPWRPGQRITSDDQHVGGPPCLIQSD